MGVLKRLNRLVRANLNDLASRAASRDVMYEVDESIRDARSNQVEARIAERRLSKEYEDLLDHAGGWEQRAELALRAGDEDLARRALMKKHEHDRRAQAVKEQLDEQQAYLVDLDRSLEAIELKLEGMRDMGRATRARPSPSTPPPRSGASRPDSRTARLEAEAELGSLGDHDSFQAFDEMASRMSYAEARIDALRELSALEGDDLAPDPDLESKFRQLETDRELDRLKKRQDELGELRRRSSEE